MIVVDEKTIDQCISETASELVLKGAYHESSEWQAIVSKWKFYEALNIAMCCREMPQNLLDMNRLIQPNQPWADIHFDERVGGKPLNPGASYKIWPFYGRDNKVRNPDQKFSHTYMERFWPKKAYDAADRPINGYNRGIRYKYGDLEDVVELLKRDMGTRQAYLPIFFPEDTGSVAGQRVPCTLGYHFMIRKDTLHLNYHIRSCDYYRHFRDDIYLAMRLALWVKNKINPEIKLGEFCMFISNLHIFEMELNKLKKETWVDPAEKIH